MDGTKRAVARQGAAPPGACLPGVEAPAAPRVRPGGGSVVIRGPRRTARILTPSGVALGPVAAQDVSLGGALLVASTPFHPGATLLLEQAPGGARLSFEVVTCVRRAA